MGEEENKNTEIKKDSVTYKVLKGLGVIIGKADHIALDIIKEAKEKLREHNLIEQDTEKRDYMYEVQFISANIDKVPEKLQDKLKERVESHLKRYGGSIVINYQRPMINIHVHTDEPDRILKYFMEKISGTHNKIIVENLDDQVNHLEEYYKKIPIEVTVDFINKYLKLSKDKKISISSDSLSGIIKGMYHPKQ